MADAAPTDPPADPPAAASAPAKRDADQPDEDAASTSSKRSNAPCMVLEVQLRPHRLCRSGPSIVLHARGEAMLADVAQAVLDAVAFTDMQVYSFHPTGDAHSRPAYYSDLADKSPRADKTAVSEVLKKEGDSTLFLFDYSEEFEFDVKYSGDAASDAASAVTVEKVEGELPKQPDNEEEEELSMSEEDSDEDEEAGSDAGGNSE